MAATKSRPAWERTADPVLGGFTYTLGNLRIEHSANRFTAWKWQMFHVPSTLYMCQAKNLADLKRFGLMLRERFDLRVLDRYAMGTTDAEDEGVVQEIRGLIRTTEGVSR